MMLRALLTLARCIYGIYNVGMEKVTLDRQHKRSLSTAHLNLEHFRAIAAAMANAPRTWQWIGEWESQRHFGITEERANALAEKHGGIASPMASIDELEESVRHILNREGA